MLADTESEKTKWVVALSELHRILKKNNLPNTTVSTTHPCIYSRKISLSFIYFYLYYFLRCRYLEQKNY